MKVAVLGYGTVGAGIVEMLKEAPGLTLGPVLVRPGKAVQPFMVTSMEDILADPTVEIVAEAMGGIEPAGSYAAATLRAGKHFVTANKALVAEKGLELSALARENHVAFLFSAACGGGVPFLRNLSSSARTDRILSVGGILNGTTNYMLDAMQRRGLTYGEALAEAQALGYAEADPTADVSGLDALRKIVLACAVAFDRLPVSGFSLEGIENFTAEDAEDLQRRELVCRLVTEGGPTEKGVYAFVQPVVFHRTAPECAVFTNYNLARYTGERCGPMVFQGQGAGRFPTASAVVRDLLSVLCGERAMLSESAAVCAAESSSVRRDYYVRLRGSAVLLPDLTDVSVGHGEIRGFLRDIPVSEMHRRVQNIRKDGGKVFFAAVGE